MERVKPIIPGGATQKIERPQIQPMGKKESGAPGGYAPRSERKPNQPVERAKPVAPDGAAQKIEKPKLKPGENVEPPADQKTERPDQRK
jgi:hypothetical protein